jgi:hypothetical protein
MAESNDSKNNDRKLDEMLDSMLSTYSAAEPRPGLETRILANLKEQSAQRSSRWSLGWMWIGGIATIAAVIMLVTYLRRPQPLPVDQPITTQAPQKTNPVLELQEQKKIPALSATSHPKHVRPAVSSARVPNEVAAVRQEVFPSPSPLSEQEKLLLRYLSRTPRQELVAQSRPDPPEEADDKDSREPMLQNLIQVPQRNSNTR